MLSERIHQPVLLKEVLQYLDPQPNENFIDCTIGGGGHSEEILKKTQPSGLLLGIDWDEEILAKLKKTLKKYAERLLLVNDNFAHLKEIVKKNNFQNVQGILFDLGLSSYQLAKEERGFALRHAGPLDMRFSKKTKITAREIINNWSEKRLAGIFKEYGEERFAFRLAKRIVLQRRKKPIATTADLANIILSAIPQRYQHRRLHPATKVFQALRIAVNNELENLSLGLTSAKDVLEKGGRIAVISFHSLEDRIVKNFFRKESKDCLCPKEFIACRCDHKKTLKIITKKPITPSQKERETNPRSRSAKLRVAERL